MSVVSHLQSLEVSESALLFELNAPHHTISVREYKNYRWLQIGGNAIQSLIDLDNTSRVVVPVNQTMLLATLFATDLKNILILGSGGGSFERFFVNHFPQLKITSVEKSHQVINLAHNYFYFPETVSIINGRADHFLADWSERFDIILCDIFEGENHPSCLLTDLFYEQLQNRLSLTGVIAINLLTVDQQSLVEILRSARQHFKCSSLCVVPDHNNAVLIASNHAEHTIKNKECLPTLQSALRDLDVIECISRIHPLPPPR